MKNKRYLQIILLLSALTLFPACASGSSDPQAALLGEWQAEGWISTAPLYATILTFYEDGRLVIDGQESNAAEYVIIAPGRIKITFGEDSEVIGYEISEDTLNLESTGGTQTFILVEKFVIETKQPTEIETNQPPEPNNNQAKTQIGNIDTQSSPLVLPSKTFTNTPILATYTNTPSPTFSQPTQTSSAYVTPTPVLYTPLSGCAASHLHVGDSAFISYEGRKNMYRKNSDVSSDTNVIGNIQPGEVIQIIGGPQCSYGWLMWEVRTTWGDTGWTPETDGKEFWILPLTTHEVCNGALPARLTIGDRAKVTEYPPLANLLREGPSRFDDDFDRIQPGHWMLVLEGPVCGEKTNWWKVQSEDTGNIGWTMEGDLENYYLAPEP
jgi:hypothetical protein